MSTTNREWPPQTPMDVQMRLADHLRRLADLASYLGLPDPRAPDQIVVKSYDHQPGCSGQAKPTIIGTSVDEGRLLLALSSTEVMNAAFVSFKLVKWAYERAACVTEAGLVDQQKTIEVDQQGPSQLDNVELQKQEVLAGRLPRRTPDQIQAMIAGLLRDGAEVGACFEDTDDGMTVLIRADLTVATKEVPQIGDPVEPREAFGTLQRALSQLNTKLQTQSIDELAFEQKSAKL